MGRWMARLVSTMGVFEEERIRTADETVVAGRRPLVEGEDTPVLVVPAVAWLVLQHSEDFVEAGVEAAEAAIAVDATSPGVRNHCIHRRAPPQAADSSIRPCRWASRLPGTFRKPFACCKDGGNR